MIVVFAEKCDQKLLPMDELRCCSYCYCKIRLSKTETYLLRNSMTAKGEESGVVVVATQ